MWEGGERKAPITVSFSWRVRDQQMPLLSSLTPQGGRKQAHPERDMRMGNKWKYGIKLSGAVSEYSNFPVTETLMFREFLVKKTPGWTQGGDKMRDSLASTVLEGPQNPQRTVAVVNPLGDNISSSFLVRFC